MTGRVRAFLVLVVSQSLPVGCYCLLPPTPFTAATQPESRHPTLILPSRRGYKADSIVITKAGLVTINKAIWRCLQEKEDDEVRVQFMDQQQVSVT